MSLEILGGTVSIDVGPTPSLKRRVQGRTLKWDHEQNKYVPFSAKILLIDSRTDKYIISSTSESNGYFQIKGVQVLPDGVVTALMYDTSTGEAHVYGKCSLVV